MAVSNKAGRHGGDDAATIRDGEGYATLYGDMAGGYNVMKDVYKTGVRALQRRTRILPEGALGPKGR